MPIVFFVHGTGVRSQGYNDTLNRIAAGLKDRLPGVGVKGIDWGDLTGVHLTSEQIANILPQTAVRAIGGSPEEVDAQRWAMLLDDPLFELRLAAVREPAAGARILVGAAAQARVAPIGERLQAMSFKTQEGAPRDVLAGGVPAKDILEAAAWLATNPDAAAVVNQAEAISEGPDDPVLVGATARALVARALSGLRGGLGEGPDALFVAAARDLLVSEVQAALTEGVRGALTDWIKNTAIHFAEARATAYGKDRRSGLMGVITPGIGDILLYQRRGEVILQAIEAAITEYQEDVWVVGHSLGGIMLVDMMSKNKLPERVQKLITVGSQSPFFLLSNALATLRPTGDSATPFVPWLNIYDRNDFLSFCATRVFPGIAGIHDEEVASGVPFPDSHGAYWRLDKTYELIADFCRS